MMTRKSWFSFFAAVWLSLLLGSVSTVQASSGLSHSQIREAHQAGEIKSLRWVLAQIKQDYPGHVLDAELAKRKSKNKKYNPRYIYKIKLLADDGHIMKLYVDANTAEVLRVKSRDKKRRHHKGNK